MPGQSADMKETTIDGAIENWGVFVSQAKHGKM